MAPRKKSLLGASNPVVQDPGFLPALSSNLAALGPMGGNGGGVPASPVPTVPPAMSFAPTPTPIATPSAPLANTVSLVNKTGTQSLYQRCSYALGRLLRIEGIASFFTLSNSGRAPPRLGLPQDDEAQKGPRDSTVRARQSTDPVRQLWDLLALGVPLCILYNALPRVDPLQIDCSIEETERKLAQASAESKTPTNKHAKHATAFFIMGLKQLAESGDLRGQPEMFTVSELFGNNTNGFVKVVSTVIFLLERLPESIFSPAPPSPPSLVSQFSTSIPATPGLFPSDSLDSLTSPVDAPSNGFPFPPTAPSLSDDESFRKKHIQETLDAERKYVADLEVMHEYARELIQKNVVDADTVHHLFPGLGKLLDFGRRFLIEMEGTAQCPWEDQRWGLLFIDNEEEFAVYEPYCANYTNASELMLSQEQNLMNLAHVVNPKTELPMFLIKPVQKICKYHLQLLDLIKRASKETYPHYDELQQGYQVAKRIADQANETIRKVDNRNTVKALEARVDDWKGHQLHNFGELLLEDIFIVTKAEVDREYHVFLFEKIILCCKEVVAMDPRKAGTIGKVSKSGSLLKKQQSLGPGGMPSPALGAGAKRKTPLLLKGRIFLNNVTKTVAGKPSHALQVWWRGDDDLEFFTLRCRSEEQLTKWETNINQLIKENANRRASDRAARQQHDRALSTSSALSYAATPPPYSSNQPLPPYPGPRTPRLHGHPFVAQEDDGDYPASGRATPLEARRSQPPERERERGEYERPRARTEGADGATMMQYRQHPPPMPPPTGGLPSIPRGAPLPPRGGSEASFGPGREPSFSSSRPVQNLRSKFSSTRLRSAYDSQNASTESMPKVHEGGHPGEDHDGHVSRESATTPTPRNGSAPPHLRMRSASQPSAYVAAPPQQPPPPVPRWNGNGSASSLGTSPEEKRGSGSSESTNLSSEYSPTNTQSPITPFGDGAGMARRLLGSGESVRVKVHYKTDLFQIIVPRDTVFNDLVTKVAHKVRLCGEAGERDAPLRVKYRDEDGDMISLGSDDDVQMAFDGTRTASGGVELWVS
ncbi:Guanine nucleotide exchange factor for Cdc42p [Rhizoctonia solani]